MNKNEKDLLKFGGLFMKVGSIDELLKLASSPEEIALLHEVQKYDALLENILNVDMEEDPPEVKEKIWMLFKDLVHILSKGMFELNLEPGRERGNM